MPVFYRKDMMPMSQFSELLKEYIKKKDITIGLVESGEGSTHLIKIMCNEECYNEKVKKMIYLYISNI